MNKNYKECLECELLKAETLFSEAKKNAIYEIENMTADRAVDFGAAHASSIDKVTVAATRVMALREQIMVYDWHMTTDRTDK